MKKLITITSLILITVLTLTLAACSSYGKIEKALNDIGYTVVETSDDKTADKMDEESEVAITAHVLSNKDTIDSVLDLAKINYVIVLEFKATEDMKTFYEDSETLQGLVKDVKEDGTAEEFYNSLVEKGIANGNCLVISTNILMASEVCEAVKNA